jgi:hypothetical protein
MLPIMWLVFVKFAQFIVEKIATYMSEIALTETEMVEV